MTFCRIRRMSLSGLSQSRVRAIVFLAFSVIAFLSFASGERIGISPPEIVFFIEEGKEECRSAEILAEEGEIVFVKDLWAREGEISRVLDIHYLKAEELGISIDYPKEMAGSGYFKVCTSSERAGNYHGVLLFSGKSNVGVGMWIVLNASKEGKKGFITGRAIFNGSDVKKMELVWMMAASPTLLLILLVLLTYSYIRKGSKGNLLSKLVNKLVRKV